MATWKEPKNDYKPEDQVVPAIFNNLAENERYLQEKKITTEQVQDAEVTSTQSASRESVGDKETIKGFFGKVRKWLADLRALAFKATVATADIDNSAVTTEKINGGAVTTTKVADSSITAAKINASAVTAAKLAADAVETVKIKNGAVTADKISDGAVTSGKITSGAVTTDKLGAKAVTSAKIDDKAVTDEKVESVATSKVTGLAAVATSGSYNDLSDKPSIPSASSGLQFKKLAGADSKYDAFDLGAKSATYIITPPTKSSNLIVVQVMLTCANKFWVTLFLRQSNPWSYATDTPALFWLRSINGTPGTSYGFISLEASLSGNKLYVSGWKINQSDNSYTNSHSLASKCYFALDSVYEILNSSG